MKPMHPQKRCAKIVHECEQMILDAEWWNNNRLDAEPMDCEPERVLLPIARKCLAAWDAGDRAEISRLSALMVEVATQESRKDGEGQ